MSREHMSARRVPTGWENEAAVAVQRSTWSFVTVSAAIPLSLNPALEALSDGFCMIGPDGRITYWNAAAERMLGAPREGVLGLRLSEAFGGVDEAALGERLAELRAGGPLRLPGDEVFPDAPRAFTVVATAAEDCVALQLRAPDPEAERSLGVLDSIRHGCVAVDAQGRIAYANRAARGVLGARRAMAGTEIWSLLPDEPAVLRRTLAESLADGRPHRLQAIQVEAEPFRGRFFDVWTRPLAEGGASILFEDVTSRIARDE
ncbi:MAG TPA: PAS domain-containing protein, partial [Longimicrobium sp.]